MGGLGAGGFAGQGSFVEIRNPGQVAQSRVDGNGVSFGPPVTDFTCGSGTLKIPLRGESGRARPGKMLIRARTSDNSGKVRAIGSLKLTCLP